MPLIKMNLEICISGTSEICIFGTYNIEHCDSYCTYPKIQVSPSDHLVMFLPHDSRNKGMKHS